MSENQTEIEHTQNPEHAVETTGGEPSVSAETEAPTADAAAPAAGASQDVAVYTTALI